MDDWRSLDDDDSLSSYGESYQRAGIRGSERARQSSRSSTTSRRPCGSPSVISMTGSSLGYRPYSRRPSSLSSGGSPLTHRLGARRLSEEVSRAGTGNSPHVNSNTSHLLLTPAARSDQIQEEAAQPGPSSPAYPTPDELKQRLHTLLEEVITVIRSYSTTLNPSTRRVHALHSFYDRVYDRLNPPSPDLFAMNTTGVGRGQAGLDPSIVEQLEREWWDSEVVAAWYGPVPALNAARSPRHARSHIAIEEARVEETRAADTRPAPGLNANANADANQRDREEIIKRDASYVGLYDE